MRPSSSGIAFVLAAVLSAFAAAQSQVEVMPQGVTEGLGMEFRLTEKSALEVQARPAAVRKLGESVPISVTRDGAAYRDLLKKLDGQEEVDGRRAVVGGRSGDADRTIVADVFFARTEPGVTPILVTGDGSVYKNLAFLGGVNPKTGERISPKNLGQSVGKAFPHGFPVTIAGRTIWVDPVSE